MTVRRGPTRLATQAGRQRGEQCARRVGGREDPGLGLAEAELVDVFGQQRRDRGKKATSKKIIAEANQSNRRIPQSNQCKRT